MPPYPVFHPSATNQKVIYSPGHGTGWTTSVSHPRTPEFLAWIITYEPIIDFLESYNTWFFGFDWSDAEDIEERWRYHECQDWMREQIVQRFEQEAKERFGMQGHVDWRGITSLGVEVVKSPFIVMEYDGDESVVELGAQEQVWIPWGRRFGKSLALLR